MKTMLCPPRTETTSYKARPMHISTKLYKLIPYRILNYSWYQRAKDKNA